MNRAADSSSTHEASMTEANTDELLNSKQASRALRLTITDLRRWRQGRAGPPYVIRKGSILYRRSDLDRWLAEQKTHPAAT
jgi:hypothetical protein